MQLKARIDFRKGTTFNWNVVGGTGEYEDLHGHRQQEGTPAPARVPSRCPDVIGVPGQKSRELDPSGSRCRCGDQARYQLFAGHLTAKSPPQEEMPFASNGIGAVHGRGMNARRLVRGDLLFRPRGRIGPITWTAAADPTPQGTTGSCGCRGRSQTPSHGSRICVAFVSDRTVPGCRSVVQQRTHLVMATPRRMDAEQAPT